MEISVKETVEQKQLNKRLEKKGVMSRTSSSCDILIHFPKDPECDICCKRSKPQKARCQSTGTRHCDALPMPQVFGDAGTQDHKVMNEDDNGSDGDRNARIALDRATCSVQAYGDERETVEATVRAMQQFVRISQICKYICSENSEEIRGGCEQFMLSHDASTPCVLELSSSQESNSHA